MNTQEIPYGYCHCGCGQKTKISPENDKIHGWIKGEPRQFLHGHWTRLKWRPAEERFWSNTDKREVDQCWEWQGYRNDAGYGTLRIGDKDVRAHRYSYELHYGAIADDILVLHRCDNPPCVNPNHLFLGSHAANMQDKSQKGRANRPLGQGRGYSTFTNQEAEILREQFRHANMSIRSFAELHNTNRGTMSNILKGFAYKE